MFKLFFISTYILYSHHSYADCSIPGWPNCSIEDANRALDRKQEQNLLMQQQRQLIEIQNQQLFELQRANQLREQNLKDSRSSVPMPMTCYTTYDRLFRTYETRCMWMAATVQESKAVFQAAAVTGRLSEPCGVIALFGTNLFPHCEKSLWWICRTGSPCCGALGKGRVGYETLRS